MTEEEYYREAIIDMVNQINDKNILIKIFTVIKTHLQILREQDERRNQNEYKGKENEQS